MQVASAPTRVTTDDARRYSLCESCLARQLRGGGTAQSVGHPRLSPTGRSHECYICHGLLAELDELQRRLERAVRDYDFRTFVLGASLSAEYMEREDELRAELKLRGAEPLKSELTRELGQRLAHTLRKKADFHSPDLTLLMQLPKADVQVQSRPVTVFGRYRKERRGLPQRQVFCPRCRGDGCDACGKRGYRSRTSVETILTRILKRAYRATAIRFTWIGSEDRRSLVLGQGRPFFGEVLGAHRHFVSPHILRKQPSGKSMRILQLQRADGPSRPHLRFRSKVRALIRLGQNLPAEGVQQLIEAFRNTTVDQRASRRQGIAKKRVEMLRVQRVSRRRLFLTLACDGGLNIKRWVDGGEDSTVSPSVASVLGQPVRCEHFDILDIDLEAPRLAPLSAHKR